MLAPKYCLRKFLVIQLFQLLFQLVLPDTPTQAFYTHTSQDSEPTGRSPQGSRLENKSASNSKTPHWTQNPYFLLKIKSLLLGQAWLPLFFFPQKAFSPRRLSPSFMQLVGSECPVGFHICPHMSAFKVFSSTRPSYNSIYRTFTRQAIKTISSNPS